MSTDKTRKDRYIYFSKRVGKYQVVVRYARRPFHVGFFPSHEEAVRERDRALEILSKYGEAKKQPRSTAFARLVIDLEKQREAEVEAKKPPEEETKKPPEEPPKETSPEGEDISLDEIIGQWEDQNGDGD